MADPDVGKGTFFVLVSLTDGTAAPPDTTVTLFAKPEDGHLPESGHIADRQETRYGERYVVEVPFDTEGPWRIRLVIEGPAGQGETGFPVRVTPSGIGMLATLACLVPFVVLGALWIRGALRQRDVREGNGQPARPTRQAE
jgi:hypothetical protein